LLEATVPKVCVCALYLVIFFKGGRTRSHRSAAYFLKGGCAHARPRALGHSIRRPGGTPLLALCPPPAACKNLIFGAQTYFWVPGTLRDLPDSRNAGRTTACSARSGLRSERGPCRFWRFLLKPRGFGGMEQSHFRGFDRHRSARRSPHLRAADYVRIFCEPTNIIPPLILPRIAVCLTNASDGEGCLAWGRAGRAESGSRCSLTVQWNTSPNRTNTKCSARLSRSGGPSFGPILSCLLTALVSVRALAKKDPPAVYVATRLDP